MPPKKTSRLGRGLSSLLGAEVPANIPTPAKAKAAAAAAQEKNEGPAVREIEIGQLKAGKYQPRTLIEQEKLQELSDSIRQQGVISPIIVRPLASVDMRLSPANAATVQASWLAKRQFPPSFEKSMIRARLPWRLSKICSAKI